MKNNGYFYEEKDFNEEEFNPLQILNAFQELNKCSKVTPSPIKSIPLIQSQPQAPRLCVKNKQFDQISNNSKNQADSLPKKTYIIKKQMIKQPKQEIIHRNQNSLGDYSNLSKSQDIIQENNRVNLQNVSFSENNFYKKRNLDEKETSNIKLCQQLRELESKYAKKQQLFVEQKLKLIESCGTILQQSFKKRLQFQQFLNHQNELKECIYEQYVSSKYQSEIQLLHSQQSKLKGKKGKKIQQTEQQQNKSSQQLAKKGYIGYLLNKLGKEKEKYGIIRQKQNQPLLLELSQSRMTQLTKYQFVKNFCLLSIIQGGRQNVEEILCMDMNKLQQCTIACLKFSPILPKNQRNQLFESFREINVSAKRLTSPSPNIFFPNKANYFMPIANIFSSQDQIFIINESTQKSILLSKFLNRIQFTSGDQGLALLKYILSLCLKMVEQFQHQNIKTSAIVLPKCIYMSQKFQVKFKNLIFNELVYHHFKHILVEDECYFFPPEENPEPQAATLWSIGILCYYLYFASKPFTKYNPYNWPSRQYFFAANEIQYQNKLPTSDKIRQFINTCLVSKLSTKNKIQICADLLGNLHVK